MELVIDLHEDGDTHSLSFPPKLNRAQLKVQGFVASILGDLSSRRIKAVLLLEQILSQGHALYSSTFPAGELHNQIISLEELWLGSASDLRDRLRSPMTLENRFRVFEQFLCSRMRSCDRHPAVEFALREFERLPTSPISKVIDQIGFSTRYFNQLFRDRVGLTPKLYCRVRRLQHVLRLIEGKEPVNWVDVASTCGYFDQSHLIHDFQTFANCTPTEYMAKRGFLRFHLEL